MKITLTDSRTSVTLQPRNFTVTLSGARGPAGPGLPAGGTEGQIIVKQSATDYDTTWSDNYATNVELYVKNSTAGAMTKGQVVYVSGADGTNPTITLAQATSEGGSSKTIGVLKQDLAVGASGYVITDGLLEGLNTNSAVAAGDTIWLSPTTAGGVVYGDANKPSAPNHMVFIGYVLRKNTNNGKIFVKIQNGFELQELHNVAISSPVTGQVLKYNGTTGLWSNDTDAGGINTLNGLTTSSQSFATGTSGTDFGIVSATGTHTFNLPTASASARGLLSSADWSTFNSKQTALSFDSTPTNGSTNPVTSDGVFDALALKQDVLTNPVTGTGTSGQVSYWTGTGTQGGSANLFWDAVNSRLGVGINSSLTARLHVRGSGATSSTTALLVQNGTPSALLQVLDNGVIDIGNAGASAATKIFPFSTSYGSVDLSGRNLQIFSYVTTQSAANGTFYFTGLGFSQTSGAQIFSNFSNSFNPTSGSASFSLVNILAFINQTGGANGITRGLYVNPTLTAAADWRSIEWSNNTGWGLYGAGTANNYLAGSLGIGSTSLTQSKVVIGGSFTPSTGTIVKGFDVFPTLNASGNSGSLICVDVRPTFNLGAFTGNTTIALRTTNSNGYNIVTSGTAINVFDNDTSIGTYSSSARLHVRGSGTTSSTTALLVQNSTPTTLLQVLDNGRISQTLEGSSSSTAFGTNALNVSTGANNTAFGVVSGLLNSIGANNCYFGTSAGQSNTTGNSNSYFGSSAGLNNSTGTNNLFIGRNSGRYITGGSISNTISNNSVFIGTDTRANADNETNQIVIGYQTTGNGSNTTTIGNASTTNNYIYGNFNIIDKNIVLGTTTGTKIGTTNTQKLSFWNATPVAQPTTAIAEATFTENSGGTAVNVDSTFAGYTLQQIAQALKDIGILQ